MGKQHPYDFGTQVKFENIPAILRFGFWCVWKARPKGNGKFDKIPFNGINAISTKEPNTWLTFDQAKTLYAQGGYNGVGRLMESDGLVGIDLDDTSDIPDEIKALGKTYAERSPSGGGIRLVYGTDTIPTRDISEPFEIYSGNSARFLTFTGHTLPGCEEIRSTNGQISALVDKACGCEGEKGERGKGEKEEGPREWDDPFIGVKGYGASTEEVKAVLSFIESDNEQVWVNVGMALHHHFNGSDEGFGVWDEWSRQSDKYAQNKGARSTAAMWGRFDNESATKLSFATICAYAKRNGADLAEIAKKHNPNTVEHLVNSERPTHNRFICADEILSEKITPPKWVIKHLLEKDTLAMMYGASGSGKSYVAIRLAVSVALGCDFHNHQTKQNAVVYMCGEGYRGVKDRLRAIALNEGLSGIPGLYLTNRITDFSSADDIRATVKEIEDQGIKPGVILIDTLARASGSFDENSTADMNKFVKACDFIRGKFGCVVMPIHHTGKGDKSSARGSSVLRAAMDVEVMVEHVGTGLTITSTKSKDGEPFEKLGFAFKRINFGVFDEDNDELYSNVIEPSDEVIEQDAKGGKVSPSGKKVLSAFEEVFEDAQMRTPSPAKFTQQMGLDCPAEGLLIEDVREHFYRMNAGVQDTKKKTFQRGLNDLQDKDVLALWDEVVVRL